MRRPGAGGREIVISSAALTGLPGRFPGVASGWRPGPRGAHRTSKALRL